MTANLCINCGVCCKAFIVTRFSLKDLENYKKDDPRLHKWLTEDVVLLSKENVLDLNVLKKVSVENTIKQGRQYHTCKLYDNSLCMDHDNRPFICREFPIYKGAVEPYIKDCKLSKQKFDQVETV